MGTGGRRHRPRRAHAARSDLALDSATVIAECAILHPDPQVRQHRRHVVTCEPRQSARLPAPPVRHQPRPARDLRRAAMSEAAGLNLPGLGQHLELPAAASRPWPRSPRALELCFAGAGRMITLDEFLELTCTLALVVVVDGVIVEERYGKGTGEADQLP